jgi:hypothetical protein
LGLFFGYLIELADPSDNDPDHPISKLIHWYPENSGNQTLIEILTMGADMDYATLINMMYYLPELPLDPNYEFPVGRARELGFESEEDLDHIRRLVEKLNAFYTESGFEKIWNDLEPYRAETLAQLARLKPSDPFMDEIEGFYGTAFDQYEIVPSLTIWHGPGWGVTDKKREKATFILGPMKVNYVFEDENFQSLTIHEFGQSFANSTVLQYGAELEKTKELFNPVQSDMVPQGYSDWQTCMLEHFVRAGEVIVMQELGNHAKSEVLLKDYRDKRKFIYLDFVVKKLRDYRLEEKRAYHKAVHATLSDLDRHYLSE